MNKNTLIGFALMALVLFGFMAYNNYSRAEQEEEMRIQDSIEGIQAAKKQVEQKKIEAKIQEAANDSLNPLFKARKGTESATVIENELLKITLSNRGGQLKKVELKDSTYKSQNGGNVVLFDGKDNDFNILVDGKYRDIRSLLHSYGFQS